jgi:hypothetical protein
MDLSRGRAAVSKLAVPVALIVILVAAGAFVFFTRSSLTSSSTQSSNSSALPTITVRTAVNQFVQQINNRSIEGVLTFYTPTSLVVWSGNTGGLVGKYNGAGNIRLIYAASVGKTTKISTNVSNFAENIFSPTHENATFVIGMHANSTTVGTVNATVLVSQEWNWGNGGWQIARENWNYKFFDASFLDAQQGSATTFPQWGVMKIGGNPNLVSEKSFEWQAGSFVAAGVYAFLFSIAFLLAVKLRSRGERPDQVRKGGPPSQTRESVRGQEERT